MVEVYFSIEGGSIVLPYYLNGHNTWKKSYRIFENLYSPALNFFKNTFANFYLFVYWLN